MIMKMEMKMSKHALIKTRKEWLMFLGSCGVV